MMLVSISIGHILSKEFIRHPVLANSSLPPHLLQEPSRSEVMTGLLQYGIFLHKRKGIRPGIVQDTTIANDVGDPEIGQPGLPRPHEFAGTADGQVLFGNPETIVGLFHDPEIALRASSDLLCCARRMQKDGMSLRPTLPRN